MKQVLIRKGSAIVAEVPMPGVERGEVLVRVQASCLSVGTELSGMRQSAAPLWKKALQQPEKVATAISLIASQGIHRTWSMIEARRDAAHPTGYSAAGVVIAAGADVQDVRPGDRVACAGAQSAYHAEFIRVPRNLCTLLPDGLAFEEASTVTLGAIALQGVRRASPTLGETFVVIGMGILGQLVAQLLRANGCRVIGIDLDRSRLDLARKLGMTIALDPDASNDIEDVARITDGNGADGVIISAATTSDAVVSTAFKVCRKKGRVVLVGDVGLNLNRADFYVKEIDFLISSSYGPGRYDHRYEEQGLDYPLPYVRWTENRNMSEFLRLLSERVVNVHPLISAIFPIDRAQEAYAAIAASAGEKPLMVLLSYPNENAQAVHRVTVNARAAKRDGRIKVAVVGAGSFAKAMHLPNLRQLDDIFEIHSIVNRSGHTAVAAAKQFGARHASTSYADVLSDPEVDAVIVATRHSLHASMALEALRAGKHVLMEKPLALTDVEITSLEEYFANHKDRQTPLLLTGFNRRFSPYANRLAELVKDRRAPFIFNYRMNAGYLPPDHWVHGGDGGGRNVGEACHIYDLFTYLADASVSAWSAHSITPRGGHYLRNDNFVATLKFADGSVASLTYTALGAKEYPKETAELFVDGKLAALHDYKRLDVLGIRRRSMKTSTQNKGLLEELRAFGVGIQSGSWPIPWWQQLQVARVALAVERALHDGDLIG